MPSQKSDEQRPVLQFSVGCDGIAQDPQSGKVALVGVFDRILAPTTVPQFFIANRWTYGRGTFRERVRITDGSGAVVGQSVETEVPLPHPAGSHTVISGFVGLAFPEAKVYWVEVLLDDVLELAWPLPVGRSGAAASPRKSTQPEAAKRSTRKSGGSPAKRAKKGSTSPRRSASKPRSGPAARKGG